MTKKDYIILAKAIRGVINDDDPLKPVNNKISWISIVTWAIACALEKDNPNFSAQKFYDYIFEGIK